MVLGARGSAALLLLLVCGALGRAGASPNLVMGDEMNKPVEITGELLCHSCHAVADVVATKLGKKKRNEANVDEALENICNAGNFRVYKFIPPTMVKGCQALLERHGDDVEGALASTDDAAQACTKPCDGVEYESPADTARRMAEKQASSQSSFASGTTNKRKKKKKAKKSQEL